MPQRILLGATFLVGLLTMASAQEASCTNAGNRYKVGDVACVSACHGQQRLAKCEAATSTGATTGAAAPRGASWTYLSETCPSAGILESPWPAAWSRLPEIAPMSPIPANFEDGLRLRT